MQLSAFQRAIRGSCQKLTEHICKTMNELNLERCRWVACVCMWVVSHETVAWTAQTHIQ